MGLLGKAVLNERPSAEKSGGGELDEMGKTLRDRLLSLSGAAPETAISLLKAYGSFRVGVCLSFDGGLYRSYAAVGTGNSIELPADLLQKIPDGNRYAVMFQDSAGGRNSPEIRDSTGIRGIPSGTKFWAFSLDENDGDPPAHILLVGEDKNYIFPGGAVESLVREAKSAFVPSTKTEQAGEEAESITEDDFPFLSVPDEQLSSPKTEGLLALAKKHSAGNITVAADDGYAITGDADAGYIIADDTDTSDTGDIDTGDTDTSDTGDISTGDTDTGDTGIGSQAAVSNNPDEMKILSFLSSALEKNGSVHGLVFEGQADEFAARIRGMVSAFADTIELGAGRCLVTGGLSLDCELLSHRLSASVPGKKLACFSAENSGKALDILRAYL